MNMTLKTGLSTLAIAVTTALLAGCGGGGGSNTNTPTTPAVTKAEGKAVDFYLSGATVNFDNCSNTAPVKTDEVGGFTYPTGCSDTALTVTGGTDIGTDLPFEGVLKAPRTTAGTLNIASSLTTLMANSTAGAAGAAALANKLGLSGVNLLSLDPMTNQNVIKKTVVVQQFTDQIQKTLLQVSASMNGRVTAQEAANASAAALSTSITGSSGTNVDLTSTTLAESAVSGAILKAAEANPSSLPVTGDALQRLAANTGAVAAATIAEKVKAVNNIEYVAISNANAASLKSALGSKLDSIKATSTSPAVGNLINSVASILTASGLDVNALRALGSAVATSPSSIAGALNAVNNSLPAGSKLSTSIVSDLQQNDTYNNYVQIDSLSLNGGASYDVATVEASVATGRELAVTGPLTSVQVKLNKVGSPFQNNLSEARIGLSYTIGSNQLDLIIDKVNLTFNASGALTGATIPVNTTYSYRIAGAVTASGTTSPNRSADVLAVSNGAVTLPIDTFLTKVATASGATSSQIDNYRPKSGNLVNLKVAMGKTADTTVRVGTGTGTTAKAARAVNITVPTSTTTIVLNGQGVTAAISVK